MKKERNGYSYIEMILFEASHCTPCHASPQGSPALATHPGSVGEPNAAYKLLIAATVSKQRIQPSSWPNAHSFTFTSIQHTKINHNTNWGLPSSELVIPSAKCTRNMKKRRTNPSAQIFQPIHPKLNFPVKSLLFSS